MKRIIVMSLVLLSLSAKAQQVNTGKNMLSVTALSLSQTTPTAVGLQYDRFFDKKDKWDFNMPVSYSFGHSDPCDASVRTRMLRAYPGIRFYPKGSDRMIAYAVGANAVIGKGESNCNCTVDPNYSTTAVVGDGTVTPNTQGFKPMTEVGLLLDGAINLQASKSIFIGTDLGIGGSYVNYNASSGLGLAFKASINIGYRF